MSRYHKGKTNLDFTEAGDSEWQWHQLGYMQVCTSLQRDNHASTSPLSFLQAGCPSIDQSCRPTNNVKALKAKSNTSSLNSTRCVRWVRLDLWQVRQLCLVVDLSTQSRHVRALSVGLVRSQTKSMDPCSGIWKWHRHNQTTATSDSFTSVVTYLLVMLLCRPNNIMSIIEILINTHIPV